MIIAAHNPKDGVGKTTTAVNMAAVLAQMGRTVLLVDLEADMNASISLGVRPAQARPSVAELLLKAYRPPDTIRPLAAAFDLVVLDSSSGYSLLSTGAYLAADQFIVPIRAGYLSLESLAHVLRWYRDRRAGRHAKPLRAPRVSC